MRIALDHTSEIGVRAGRLLLGESELTVLGIVRRAVKDRDTRLRRVNSITDFDAVVTDDPESTILAEAMEAGVPCVFWGDTVDTSIDLSGATVLAGSNLVSGIGRSLAEREADDSAQVLFAWTEPGKPIRSGEPISFPEPVGPRWGTRRGMTNRRLDVAAPVPDEWAGIVVRATTPTSVRTFGIADLATHLEAIGLAAGAMITALGLVPTGLHTPDEFADDYLAVALRIGLDMASFTSTG
ncbi:MAG: hypothetical protein WCC01_05590 [Acidimicrobiia bacterium]